MPYITTAILLISLLLSSGCEPRQETPTATATTEEKIPEETTPEPVTSPPTTTTPEKQEKPRAKTRKKVILELIEERFEEACLHPPLCAEALAKELRAHEFVKHVEVSNKFIECTIEDEAGDPDTLIYHIPTNDDQIPYLGLE